MMRKLISVIFSAVFLFSVFYLTGCEFGNSRKLIGVSMPSLTQPRWVQDGENIRRQLEAKGFTVDLRNAGDSVDNQIKQIDEMISSNCRLLVICAIDSGSLSEVLEKAAKKKITVISYDRLITGTENVDYYAAFDNFEVGAMQARYIEEVLRLKDGKGPFGMELFSGALDDSTTLDYYAGQISILKQYLDNGQLVIRSGQTDVESTSIPNWDSNNAKFRMEKLLADYYSDSEPLDAILSTNDSIAIGIIAALKEAGYGTDTTPFPILTGQDGDKENVLAIINGEQSMSAFIDTRTLAARTVEMVDDIMVGKNPKIDYQGKFNNGVKDVPAAICMPVYVDKENYRRVLIDSGYYKESDFR